MTMTKRSLYILAATLLLLSLAVSTVFADDLKPKLKFSSPAVVKAIKTGTVTIRITVTGDDTNLVRDITVTQGATSQDFKLANLPKNKVLKVEVKALDSTGATLDTIKGILKKYSADPTESFTIDGRSTVITDIVESIASLTGKEIWTLNNTVLAEVEKRVTANNYKTVDKTAIATELAKMFNATLKSITLSSGTLSPTFASATTNYTVSVSNSTENITITPTATETGATISMSKENPIALTVGENVITIDVTASDGETKITYTLTITRNEPGITIHMKKPSAWGAGTPTIYTWSGAGTHTGSWPGRAMQDDGNGWYSSTISGLTQVNVIFSMNGDSGRRTGDLSRTGDGYYYTDGRWYDEMPMVVLDVSNGIAGGTVPFATSSLDITLNTLGESNPTGGRYTHDGSDPASSSTAVTFANGDKITIGSDMAADTEKTLWVYATDGTNTLSQKYTYKKVNLTLPSDARLGATYTPSATTFAIWSPDTANVVVNVGGVDKVCARVNDFNGYNNVYAAVVENVAPLTEYYFKINGTKVRDPYGVMVNNALNPQDNQPYDNNVVMDLTQTNPVGWESDTRPALTAREDAIIYEAHVRDLTMDPQSGADDSIRGRYLAINTGTTGPGGVKTGIDHMKELGVTHVQLLPLQDANYSDRNAYSWGYDPRNYNIPEEKNSQYVPTDADYYVNRIKEYKAMIKRFHDAGIRVIMDVVYNHTHGTEVFGGISNRYYVQNDTTNLSGAGPSLNTAEAMVSRFIQDSLDYWISEYHVDGFRFDLMGIHHQAEVEKWGAYINTKYSGQNILVYGEPWSSGTDPNVAVKFRLGKVPQLADEHVGAFDDQFRNALRGDNNRDRTTPTGYIHNTGNAQNVVYGIKGSITAQNSSAILSQDFDPQFALDPEQAIHYVACHDNYTLWDMIKRAGKDNAEGRKIDMFASAILLTSQGIPFIHAGDEMLRTKKFDNNSWENAYNSYNQPDSTNMIRWQWKVDNDDVFKYYKGLIAMRKAHPAFRMQTWTDIDTNVKPQIVSDTNIIITQINGAAVGDTWSKIILIYNPTTSPYNYNTLPSGTWYKADWADGTVKQGTSASGSVTCEAQAVTVLYQQ